MSTMASQIYSLTIIYLSVYSGLDQRKHQWSAALAFVRGMTGKFPAQRASNAENVSIRSRHHEIGRDKTKGQNEAWGACRPWLLLYLF